MASTLQFESTLTDRYQTTIPESIRRTLHLHKRDKLQFTIRPNGEVVVSRAEMREEDPLLGQFLAFIAQDIAQHPEHLQAIDTALVARIHALIGNAENEADLDLDAPLSAEDE